MSDGPFKNLKMNAHWRRFAEAAQNDAADDVERCALASHAIVNEVLVNETRALLVDLNEFVGREQLDIDPMSSVESICDKHEKSPFSDGLQKELMYRLSQGVRPEEALPQATKETLCTHINEARNHIQEEFIRARDSGDIKQAVFDATIKISNNALALSTLPVDGICAALLAGNKNAFKEVTKKKKGLDEGPSL